MKTGTRLVTSLVLGATAYGGLVFSKVPDNLAAGLISLLAMAIIYLLLPGEPDFVHEHDVLDDNIAGIAAGDDLLEPFDEDDDHSLLVDSELMAHSEYIEKDENDILEELIDELEEDTHRPSPADLDELEAVFYGGDPELSGLKAADLAEPPAYVDVPPEVFEPEQVEAPVLEPTPELEPVSESSNDSSDNN